MIARSPTTAITYRLWLSETTFYALFDDANIFMCAAIVFVRHCAVLVMFSPHPVFWVIATLCAAQAVGTMASPDS